MILSPHRNGYEVDKSSKRNEVKKKKNESKEQTTAKSEYSYLGEGEKGAGITGGRCGAKAVGRRAREERKARILSVII